MSYDMRYSLINTFKSVDKWRQNIMYNMSGVMTPGFKPLRTDLGHKVSVSSQSAPQSAKSTTGARPAPQVAVGHLEINRTTVELTDEVTSKIRNSNTVADGSTDMAIAGSANAFFAVSESLQQGSRVFLTRGGNFQFRKMTVNGVEKQYLTTSNGMFVLRNVDVDTAKMTVKDNTKTINATSTSEQLTNFYNELGWPPSTQTNYTSTFGVKPGDANFKSFILNFAAPGIMTSPPTMVDDGNGNMIPNEADYTNPAVMRDAIFGRGDHTNGADNTEAYELRGLVLSGEGNENQYTGRGPSHMAVITIPDPAALQVSAYGTATYEVPQVNRAGIQVSSNQKLLNATGTINSTNITERGVRIVGHLLETPEASSLLSKLSQESEVANFVYKNLSQMLTDYNSSLDELFKLVN